MNASLTLTSTPDSFTSLQGQLLIAMPQMEDPRFHQAVMVVLEHNAEGAMGLIVNRPLDDLTFGDLLVQIRASAKKDEDERADMDADDDDADDIAVPVCFGGPVEIGRGFVLHSPDVMLPHTKRLHDRLALTTSLDMIDLIARRKGPHKALLALGYAGWQAGQLEDEMQANAWLTAPLSADLLFDVDPAEMWDKAMASVGISLGNFSSDAGHA